MKLKTLRIIFCIAVAIVLPFALAASGFAQTDKYKPGDKIEYKVMGSYPERWEKGGTYVGATPGGSQPLIREKPNEFYPQGSERAASWDTIRPMGAQPKDPVKAKEGPPVDTVDRKPKDPPPAEDAGKAGKCTAMLTENDVLSFFQEKLGDTPFADSGRKEKAENEMAAMARDCGVNFRYQNLSPFADKLGKFGAISTTIYPLMANFGPPTKQAWYIGTWTNNVQSESYVRIIAAKTGFLTIAADGSYTWKLYRTDPPAKYVKGKWRLATADEMKVSYQGGAGAVLLNGKEGYDWIVRQDRETTMSGRWIVIANINSRAQREFGFQK